MSDFIKKNNFSIIYFFIVIIFLLKNFNYFLTINKYLFLIFLAFIFLILLFLIFEKKNFFNKFEYLFLSYFFFIAILNYGGVEHLNLFVSNLVFPAIIFLFYKVYYYENEIIIFTNSNFIKNFLIIFFILSSFFYFPHLYFKIISFGGPRGTNIEFISNIFDNFKTGDYDNKYYKEYLEMLVPEFKYWANYIFSFFTLSIIIIIKNLSLQNNDRLKFFILILIFIIISFTQMNFYNFIIQTLLITYLAISEKILRIDSNILKVLNLILFIITILTPIIYFSDKSQKYAKNIVVNASELILPDFKKDEKHPLSGNCDEKQKISKVAEYFFLRDDPDNLKRIKENINQEIIHKEPYTEYCEFGLFYYIYVGFLRRLDQNENIFLNGLSIKEFLFGFNHKKISINDRKGFFTHNSYLNLITRYGFISYVLFFFFMIRLIKSKNLDQEILFFLMLFIFFQNFDDYLFGNRLETTILFWFLFFSLIKKKVLNDN